MIRVIRANWAVITILIAVFAFFAPFWLKGLLPIPSDTIVGLYHPFRDLYAKNYPNGIPFKNFLITDPVRQTYPWRELSISMLKKPELPLWNPYGFSGTPLLANFQSAVFYPFNLALFIFPFSLGWSILIFLQPLLAGIFLYFYLSNLSLNRSASFLGAFVFVFSGFSIAWLEWGTVIQVILWLPLILLSIDNFFISFKSQGDSRLQLKSKNSLIWSIIFLFALVSSFFAGHLQTFFYLYLISILYFLARFTQFRQTKKVLLIFLILNSLFIILAVIQWVPTLRFILLSARNTDQSPWTNSGWFIPWQNLIQFIAPDFFGNPATLNYWGIWNYAEFVGYVGIFPLIAAIFALFFRHDRKTLFFGIIFFLSLIFSLPTIFAKLPFILKIPFIDTAQPTRLLFLTDFSLSVLASLGFDYFLRQKKHVFYPLGFFGAVFAGLWFFVLFGKHLDLISTQNLLIAKHNLILPSILFIVSFLWIAAAVIFSGNPGASLILRFLIVIVVIFDLFRFGLKFTPFTKREYLFPKTSLLLYLQKNIGNSRIMATDSRILPPNFALVYHLQSVDGYDPLYLRRYAELIAASERRKPDISPPFGFNRIITPHNFSSGIMDLLGVKYVLSLSDLRSQKLKKVFQEGETRVYENKNAFPRVFFVKRLVNVLGSKEAIDFMFNHASKLRNEAVVQQKFHTAQFWTLWRWAEGQSEIVSYSENKVVIKTENRGKGFLVLTDTFYPTWHVKIDGRETKIYRTDFDFRGVIVPKGRHTVEFYDTLF